jgi:hypothetical protein
MVGAMIVVAGNYLRYSKETVSIIAIVACLVCVSRVCSFIGTFIRLQMEKQLLT